jgi:hypothetical protein
MRHALLLSLLFISTGLPATSTASPATTAAPAATTATPATTTPAASRDADVVKAAELKRFEAAEKDDFDTLDKLLADDLTYGHSTGVLETKAVFLASLKSGKLKFKKIEPADVQVRVFGATAIITGTAKLAVVSNGEAKDVAIRFTDAWVRRAGRWQMVAWQSTKLPLTDDAAPTPRR